MNRVHFFFLTCLCCAVAAACTSPEQQQEISIVPKPVSVQTGTGHFTLTPKTVIHIQKGEGGTEETGKACRYFSNLLAPSFGTPLTCRVSTENENKAINVTADPQMKEEAYQLNITNKAVNITAGSARGVFYAFQTLRQMMPVGIENGQKMESVRIQQGKISDEPRFAHRGAMLDVGRHLFPKEDLKIFIDMLALHKINKFHWHLTDDQGWRIEIKKYPNLTQTGSQRKETVIGRNTGQYDGKPYGGYYTQEDVKEIVQYAADRFITVIPEIELPGHAVAALTSYPELGCTGGPYEVTKEWGVFDDVFCAGNEKTFGFLQDVFDEVIPLFPSEYIHIGGDECPKTEWKKCKKCQERIRKEHLKGEHELQSYFVRRIENYLISKGKKIIGWDEILEGGVSPTATILSWRGDAGGIEAAKQGNTVIMAPTSHCYLDYYQSKDRANEPFSIGGFVDVEKVYSLEPIPAELTPEQGKLILGAQVNLWTEYISDFSHAQYMLLPRLAALSEVVWTPAPQKDYQDFVKREISFTERYKALGYNYAKHILAASDTTAVPVQ